MEQDNNDKSFESEPIEASNWYNIGWNLADSADMKMQ